MKFSLEKGSANIIHSYQPGEIKIQANSQQTDPETGELLLQTLTGSVILTPEQIIEHWLVNEQELSAKDMEQVLATQPEVILLGTGDSTQFPPPEIMQCCYQAQVGIEVMNTAAACRTYNVLAAERRRVTAALMKI